MTEGGQTVLVDTDVAIDFLRGREYARSLLLPLWSENLAFISILSIYELYAGMRENEKDKTEDFMRAFQIEPVTVEVAREAGKIYRNYRQKGLTLTTADCIIAATARVRGHKIATNNTSHYPQKGILFRGFPGR